MAEPSGSRRTWQIILSGTLALIGLANPYVAPLFTDWRHDNETKLVYQVIADTSYPGVTKKASIIAVSINNRGHVGLDQVQIDIQVPGRIIIDGDNFDFPAKGINQVYDKDSYHIEFPYLNGGENGQIKLLFDTAAKSFTRPVVKLRSHGVTGVEVFEERSDNIWLLLVSLYGGIFFAVIFVGLLLIPRHKKDEVGGSDVALRNARAIVTYLASSYNMPQEARTIREFSQSASYSDLLDYLTNDAMSRGDKAHVPKVISVLEALSDYKSINASEVSVLNFNLARLHRLSGNEVEALKAIRRAGLLTSDVLRDRVAFAQARGQVPTI